MLVLLCFYGFTGIEIILAKIIELWQLPAGLINWRDNICIQIKNDKYDKKFLITYDIIFMEEEFNKNGTQSNNNWNT